MKIYHNTRCSKSRDSFNLLKESNQEFETIEYLKTPLSKEDLKGILKKLGIPAKELVRKTEAVYKEKYANKKLSESQWIEVMIMHPKLIERPIVVKGDNAVIGRPIERVIELLND